MPPLPVVPGVCKMIISTIRSDATVENIMHIGYSGLAPSATDLNTFINSHLLAPTETMFNAEGSTDLTGASLELIDLSSDTGASWSQALTIAGTRTGDFAPSSAAVVASWEIARRYRGGHPRSYFPWGTAGTYESGSAKLWDTSFIADCLTKIEDWEAAWQPTTVGATVFEQLVNVSYYDRNLFPDPPYRRTTPLVDPITSVVVKQRICSQRRRLGKALG